VNPLIPTPDVLPAPWGWFQGFLMLTLPLHLLAMNAMVGTAALSLLARLKGDAAHARLAHELAKLLPILVAVTVNLGLAPLLFVQVLYGHLLYTSSVLMAVHWLSVPLILLVAYYATYLYDFRFEALGRWGAVPVGLAFVSFMFIAFLFTANMTLMLEPSRWSAWFNQRGGTLLDTGNPMFWARYVHNVVGAVAVGGLFVAVFGRLRAGRDPEVGDLAVRLGLKVFRSLTMGQVLVGFWYLLSLPAPVMKLFMGGSPAATGLLAAGLLLAMLVLAAGSRVALCAGLTAVLVVVMVFMRDVVRVACLSPVFTPASLKVAPQYPPLVLFVVSLAGGIALVAWMVLQALKVPTSK